MTLDARCAETETSQTRDTKIFQITDAKQVEVIKAKFATRKRNAGELSANKPSCRTLLPWENSLSECIHSPSESHCKCLPASTGMHNREKSYAQAECITLMEALGHNCCNRSFLNALSEFHNGLCCCSCTAPSFPTLRVDGRRQPRADAWLLDCAGIVALEHKPSIAQSRNAPQQGLSSSRSVLLSGNRDKIHHQTPQQNFGKP